MITLLTWLLFFSLFYLLLTSVILARNRFHLTPLRNSEPKYTGESKISVCIPARNEEKHLAGLLESVFIQQYPHFDVYVLDDQSEDTTFEIAHSYKKKYPLQMSLHTGKKKPEDWLGKSWACQQSGERCSGDIILFLDADTRLKPGFLTSIAASFAKYKPDMLTVWPHQQTDTFWEKTVIPLLYYSLVTLLPANYVHSHPRWMPSLLKRKFSPLFAAACGQCIAFKKEAYQKIGGHGGVKNEVVEDVALAKLIKQYGLIMRMFQGVGSISCRMYNSEKEMFEGLRKNFLAGFGNSLPCFLFAMTVHLVVFVLPFLIIIPSLFLENPALFFLSAASVGLIFLHRLILAIWFLWDPFYAFTHPIGVLWFQRLGIVKVADYISRRQTVWKGRHV